jgi:fumarate reductase subunit D
MGGLVGAILLRRWLMLVGLLLIVGALFLPRHSVFRFVVTIFGICLVLLQIPLTVRAARRR